MNAMLDRCVATVQGAGEAEQDEFRGPVNRVPQPLCLPVADHPYQDEELEKLYAFVRNLMTKLPPPGDGANSCARR